MHNVLSPESPVKDSELGGDERDCGLMKPQRATARLSDHSYPTWALNSLPLFKTAFFLFASQDSNGVRPKPDA